MSHLSLVPLLLCLLTSGFAQKADQEDQEDRSPAISSSLMDIMNQLRDPDIGQLLSQGRTIVRVRGVPQWNPDFFNKIPDVLFLHSVVKIIYLVFILPIQLFFFPIILISGVLWDTVTSFFGFM